MANSSLQKMGGVVTLLVGYLAISTPASALTGFQGAYAPSNWTFQNITANGNVDTTAAPTSITLTGGNNDGFFGTTSYTIAAVTGGTLSFNWNYTTQDFFVTSAFCSSIPGNFCDPFQFLINGTPTTLISSSGGRNQSGSFNTSILTGDTFGFRIATADNTGGGGSVTISNFNAPAAPIPFEFNPMLGVGILGGLWAGKRFLKSRKPK